MMELGNGITSSIPHRNAISAKAEPRKVSYLLACSTVKRKFFLMALLKNVRKCSQRRVQKQPSSCRSLPSLEAQALAEGMNPPHGLSVEWRCGGSYGLSCMHAMWVMREDSPKGNSLDTGHVPTLQVYKLPNRYDMCQMRSTNSCSARATQRTRFV